MNTEIQGELLQVLPPEPKFEEAFALDRLPSDEEIASPAPTAAMVRSVMAIGFLSPIVLRETGQGAFDLVCGRRRVKAARACGLTHVKAFVYPPTAAPKEVMILVENTQRQPNPIAELEAIEGLLGKTPPLSWEEITYATGMEHQVIKKRLLLQRLIPGMREVARRGVQMKPEIAVRAARLSPAAQQGLLDLLTGENPKKRIGIEDVHEALRKKRADASTSSLAFANFETPDAPRRADQTAMFPPSEGSVPLYQPSEPEWREPTEGEPWQAQAAFLLKQTLDYVPENTDERLIIESMITRLNKTQTTALAARPKAAKKSLRTAEG